MTFAPIIADETDAYSFADRIEITRPDHLPNHLTVAKIRSGTSITCNTILVSQAATGLLPYRGLGTGIHRALDDWDGNQFTVCRQASGQTEPGSERSSHQLPPTQEAILQAMRANPYTTAETMAEQIGVSHRAIEKHVKTLCDAGTIRCVGGCIAGKPFLINVLHPENRFCPAPTGYQ